MSTIRRLIYFLLCVGSCAIVVYMVYRAWERIETWGFTLDTIMWLLGTLGWFGITYKIVMKSYSWTRKLCK